MVRASHTLCGIHRTGGFPLVATTAKALEQYACSASQQRGAPLPGAAQPVLARAVAGLRASCARVQAREAFTRQRRGEAAEIQQELEDAATGHRAAEHGDRPTVEARARARRRRRRRAAARRSRRRAGFRRGAGGQRPSQGDAQSRARRSHAASPARSAPRRVGVARGSERPSVTPVRDGPRWPTCATTSTARCCRSSSTRRPSFSRRPASSCAPGARSPATSESMQACGARCTRSRAARAWRARCVSASSRT